MESSSLASPALRALSSLSAAQVSFIEGLPKAELHAHLNGSIPLDVLRTLASEAGVALPEVHGSLNEIHDFFNLFPAIYALTTTPDALRRMTRAVLANFLDNGGCSYLELRSTPKATDAMTREDYMRAVLEEVERYPKDQAAYIASLDRRMDEATAKEVIGSAIKLKAEGRRVVGIDLCGDPLAGDVDMLCRVLKEARIAGLELTVHIAETRDNPPAETLKFLSIPPSRLGHATFLNDEAIGIVLEKKIPIEICLSSNLLCKTAESLEMHHIRQYLGVGHSIAICTDDCLLFRNSVLAEYALLMAQKPLGLGLSEDEVAEVAEMSMGARFVSSL